MNWLERHTKWQNNEGIRILLDPYQHTHKEEKEGERDSEIPAHQKSQTNR